MLAINITFKDYSDRTYWIDKISSQYICKTQDQFKNGILSNVKKQGSFKHYLQATQCLNKLINRDIEEKNIVEIVII